MELRVETLEGSSLPKGCFVSVRVGEVQKQRRYENKGAFQFPAPAHTRKAKIDLYLHVGTCSTSVGPEGRISEVHVQPLEPNAPKATLKVTSTPKEPVEDRETKMSNVKKEAVDYLAKWLIQERLGDVVKALLQKRPDDPIEFICSFLRANAASMPTTTVRKPAPAKVEQTEPAILPFRPYYSSHMAPQCTRTLNDLYDKFPKPASSLAAVKNRAREALEHLLLFEDNVQDRPQWLQPGVPPEGVFGKYCKEHMEAAMPESPWGQLYSKFPGYKKHAPGSLAYGALPSVGTWLQPLRADAMPRGVGPAHVRAAWDLQGLRPACSMGLDERVEVERVITSALLELGGELEGEYLPLATSQSYPARPGGMSPHERQALDACGLLPQTNDADGRGVFATPKRELVVWVNGGARHVELVVTQGGTQRLRAAESALRLALQQSGHDLVGPAAICARTLKGLRPPQIMSVDERCEVERVCTRALVELTGELEGEYLPLATSLSYTARPGGMSTMEERAVSGCGLVLGSHDAVGRGVYVTRKGNLMAVVNGDSHIEFVARGLPKGEAEAQAHKMEAAVRDSIRQSGYEMA